MYVITGQIAADIAQLTEARQQYKVASKGGTAPRKLLLRRTARSAKARRQLQESEEHEGTPQPLKVSTFGQRAIEETSDIYRL